MKKKQSRKTVKRSDNHSIAFRLSDDEMTVVNEDVLHAQETSGLPVKRAAYAKHALLEHDRLRTMESKLRALYALEKPVADGHAQDIVESVDGAQDNQALSDLARVLAGVRDILEAR